jgi:hypothetical protein
MVNKQGQTRLASYYEWFPIQERVTLEAEVLSLYLFYIILIIIILIIIIDNKKMFIAYRVSMFIYRISWK